MGGQLYDLGVFFKCSVIVCHSVSPTSLVRNKTFSSVHTENNMEEQPLLKAAALRGHLILLMFLK